MSYLAIARKWRPKGFEDLVGQTHVVQTLTNAVNMGRVSHAYLFCGARGIGKTSVARVFAKVLRCPNVKQASPCHTCPECLAIAEGRSVDVVEIDGASNNGVESVRGIRDNVAYGASSGKYKIYIIDEVHMLTLSAFNALLKTLEEPPPHVIFILATTEVQKIPLTILSRCQRFEFRRLTQNQVITRLSEILKSEQIQISTEGLATIASCADGSLRDALSLLDQVLSFFGEEGRQRPLKDSEVVEALGIAEGDTVTTFWECVLKKDTATLIKIIGDHYQAGVDLKHFAERCLEELRLLYLLVLAKETNEKPSAESLDISPARYSKLSQLAETTQLLSLERMSQLLSKTISQLSWSTLPRFVLEMTAVRMTKLDTLFAVEEALLKGSTSTSESSIDAVSTVREVEREIPAAPPVPVPQPQSDSMPTDRIPPPPTEHSRPGLSPAAPADLWKNFVDFAMKKRPHLGALLSHAGFKLEGTGKQKNITLAFPKDSFYERQGTDTKNAEEISRLLREFFGPETTTQISNSLATTQRSLEAERNAKVATLKKEALESPSVIQMKTLLGADVVDVRVDV